MFDINQVDKNGKKNKTLIKNPPANKGLMSENLPHELARLVDAAAMYTQARMST
jgi:hypothetical protein